MIMDEIDETGPNNNNCLWLSEVGAHLYDLDDHGRIWRTWIEKLHAHIVF